MFVSLFHRSRTSAKNKNNSILFKTDDDPSEVFFMRKHAFRNFYNVRFKSDCATLETSKLIEII